MDPEVIRAIKPAALDADRTSSDLVEEAAKQWLERHKHKKWSEFPAGAPQRRHRAGQRIWKTT
jgi:hypothetical protein